VRVCVAAASVGKVDEEEIMIIIDEVKPDDVDETAAAAADITAPSSSTVQPSVPPQQLSVADSGRELQWLTAGKEFHLDLTIEH